MIKTVPRTIASKLFFTDFNEKLDATGEYGNMRETELENWVMFA